MKNIWLCYI